MHCWYCVIERNEIHKHLLYYTNTHSSYPVWSISCYSIFPISYKWNSKTRKIKQIDTNSYHLDSKLITKIIKTKLKLNKNSFKTKNFFKVCKTKFYLWVKVEIYVEVNIIIMNVLKRWRENWKLRKKKYLKFKHRNNNKKNREIFI